MNKASLIFYGRKESSSENDGNLLGMRDPSVGGGAPQDVDFDIQKSQSHISVGYTKVNWRGNQGFTVSSRRLYYSFGFVGKL